MSVYDPKGTYSQNAGVTMTSIFENTNHPVIIHLLHDETLTQDNRQKFLNTAVKYSQQILFHDVSSYRDKIKNAVENYLYGWTIEFLYRIYLKLTGLFI